MRSVRIHNDIHFKWTIDRGDGEPYDLTGRDLRLWMVNGSQSIEFKDFTINENSIHWDFFGKDQYKMGAYDVILCENAGKEGEVTIDEQDIVTLVAHTANADAEQDSQVEAEYVIVTSRLKTELYSSVAQEVYDNYVVRTNVYVQNGANLLRDGGSADAVAVITVGDIDITGRIANQYFSWERSSGNAGLDALWNRRHEGVGPVIHVTRDDVNVACTFYCIVPVNVLRNVILTI